MNWLLPAIAATTMGTVLLVMLYTYLYLQDRTRALLLWTFGWTMYTVRLLFMTGNILWHDHFLVAGSQIASMLCGMLLLQGSSMRLSHRISPVWWIVTGMGCLWSILTALQTVDLQISSIPPFILLGLLFLRMGILFLRHKDIALWERRFIGFAFVLWGLHSLDYPLLRPLQWFAPYGYSFGAFLTIFTAGSLLLYHFRLTKEELNRNRQQLHDMIINMPVLLNAFDEQGRPQLWNRECERVTGYKAHEIIGNAKLLDLLYPDEAVKQKVIAAILKEEGDYRELEFTLTTRNGQERIIAWSNISDSYPITGFSSWGIGVDVTEKRKTEEALREATRLAKEAVQAKSRFLANMSHDIRTPINGALGMFQTLAQTELNEEQREMMEIGAQACRNLSQLLSDILDISRAEAGKLPLRKKRLNIKTIAREVTDIFRPQALAHDISLQRKTDPAIPEWLIGDDGRLRQVLTNIIGNAIKFTQNGGSVQLHISLLPHRSERPNRLLFLIIDTGIGISNRHLENIFEPFTQGDTGDHRQGLGVGLGLGIVKRLVTLMQGTLCIDTAPGEGTSIGFTVDLPTTDAPTTVLSEATDRISDDGAHPQGALLIVEDDRINRLALQKMVERLGWKVETAVDGKEALAILREKPFECILMDIQMPVMDGFETTIALRSESWEGYNRFTPIIAMTAPLPDDDRTPFEEVGMNGYLAKPFELEALEQEIFRATAP